MDAWLNGSRAPYPPVPTRGVLEVGAGGVVWRAGRPLADRMLVAGTSTVAGDIVRGEPTRIDLAVESNVLVVTDVEDPEPELVLGLANADITIVAA
ncbi:MAG TPA: hypothetical protein VF230_08275 [Acidimicrobiales bacterium]